jgi:transcriptional regulator with XRE-family HTH domain
VGLVVSTTHAQLHDAFGAYVRSQRQLAQLTLRQVAELARISNPYLSQIEHGLVLPSISVLSALADALSVSAETMLLRAAGIVRPNAGERVAQTEDSIRHDPRLDNSQKQALLTVLSSFVGAAPGAVLESAHPAPAPAERTMAVSPEAVSGEVVPIEAVPGQPVTSEDESVSGRSGKAVRAVPRSAS